jgi:hypothetical protein
VGYQLQDREVARDWFYRCKSANLPYVAIEIARKCATLEWDCITLDPACEEAIREDHGRRIVNALFETFQRYSAGSGAKPYFFGSAFVGSIKGLRPDIAPTIADEFIAALYRASQPTGLAAA